MFSFTTLRTSLLEKIGSRSRLDQVYQRPQFVVAVAVLCAIMPVDLSQLVFILMGAICYSLVRMRLPPRSKPSIKKMAGTIKFSTPGRGGGPADTLGRSSPHSQRSPHGARIQLTRFGTDQPIGSRPVVAALQSQRTPKRTETAMPIAPIYFESEGFEGEVSELLEKIGPKLDSADLVKRVAATVKASLRSLLPGVDVVGFASTDFRSSSAFAVAAPDVEMVINVKPEVLAKRCWPRGETSSSVVDINKLQKSAVRTITERLVQESGFKFRRSAFRDSDPRVTLLTPRWDDAAPFPIEISINSMVPIHNTALIDRCMGLDSRIGDLYVLVRRWSKDRAICHAPKGHLPRYQWNLLVSYFMQVASPEKDCEHLPSLDLSATSRSSINAVVAPPTAVVTSATQDEKVSVAQLFKAFVHFYSENFRWGQEVVSTRSGKRTFRDSASPCGGIIIEDPFDTSLDLGESLIPCSYQRLREELSRAQLLCNRNASLAELLELWAPDDDDWKGVARSK